MMEFKSAAEFAVFLRKAEIEVKEALVVGTDRGAALIEAEAKAEIGEYQSDAGPFAAWQALADSTLREKESLGFAPPDNPLLREGDLRDSISRHTEPTPLGATAETGSGSDIAVWQELGTQNIPPRSFLGRAGYVKAEAVVQGIVDRVLWALRGLPARND